MKKRTIGLLVLAASLLGFLGFYFFSRRWKPFLDNNWISLSGNSMVAIVTDYDSGLSAGDEVEILQDEKAGRKASIDGKTTVIGVSKTEAGKYLFVIDKPWPGSSPTIPGKWRKLNLF